MVIKTLIEISFYIWTTTTADEWFYVSLKRVEREFNRVTFIIGQNFIIKRSFIKVNESKLLTYFLTSAGGERWNDFSHFQSDTKAPHLITKNSITQLFTQKTAIKSQTTTDLSESPRFTRFSSLYQRYVMGCCPLASHNMVIRCDPATTRLPPTWVMISADDCKGSIVGWTSIEGARASASSSARTSAAADASTLVSSFEANAETLDFLRFGPVHCGVCFRWGWTRNSK